MSQILFNLWRTPPGKDQPRLYIYITGWAKLYPGVEAQPPVNPLRPPAHPPLILPACLRTCSFSDLLHVMLPALIRL
jgi:hypothetical protein